MMRARGGWNNKCLSAEEHNTVIDRLLTKREALCSIKARRIIFDNTACKVLAALFGLWVLGKGKPSCVLYPQCEKRAESYR